jgi:hypothetical protein
MTQGKQNRHFSLMWLAVISVIGSVSAVHHRGP